MRLIVRGVMSGMQRRCCSASSSSSSVMDSTQAHYLQERCILVDDQDNAVGSASKRECHQWSSIRDKGSLHRAFSVFVFNERAQLLLQQRSAAKITFPSLWANTCCSHPLAQMEENGLAGVKAAARRKLEHELGIAGDTFADDDLHFVTRVHYAAQADAQWAEHEVDYILVARCTNQLRLHNVNANEVAATRYVDQTELDRMLAGHKRDGNVFTPWLLLITRSGLLRKWWANLDNLASVAEPDTIHRFGLFDET